MADAYALEGHDFVYKIVPSPIELLVHDIAAFANNGGGTIVIGARPSPKGYITFGLSNEEANDLVEQAKRALHLLRPQPLINPQVKKRYRDYYIFIKVQKSPTPVLFEGTGYYVRKGNTTTLAEEEELIDALSESVPSIKQNILNSLHIEQAGEKKHEDISKRGLGILLGEYFIEDHVARGDIDKSPAINKALYSFIRSLPEQSTLLCDVLLTPLC